MEYGTQIHWQTKATSRNTFVSESRTRPITAMPVPSHSCWRRICRNVTAARLSTSCISLNPSSAITVSAAGPAMPLPLPSCSSPSSADFFTNLVFFWKNKTLSFYCVDTDKEMLSVWDTWPYVVSSKLCHHLVFWVELTKFDGNITSRGIKISWFLPICVVNKSDEGKRLTESITPRP